MRWIVVLVAMLLNSCVAIERGEKATEQPYGVRYTNEYVNNLNWSLLYMFAYVKSVNEYAVQHGWSPPKTAPLCRLVEWPKLLPLPQFRPSFNRDNPRSFEIELADYVKVIKRVYHDSREDLKDAELIQRQLCIY